MADDRERIAERLLPNATPDERAAWLQKYGMRGEDRISFADPKKRSIVESFSLPRQKTDAEIDAAAGARPFTLPGQRGTFLEPDAPKENPFSQLPRAPDAWSAQDAEQNAEAKRRAERLVAGTGQSTESARKYAGVRVEPGEIGPPKDAREGATFAAPSETSSASTMGAPTLVSKGGRTPHSWTTQTQEGMKFSPETKEKQDQAEGAHLGAAEAARDAGLAEAQKEYAYLDAHERLQAARASEIKAREAQRVKMFDSQLGKLRSMTDAVARDDGATRAWWQNKEGGIGAGLIFGAIGTMLGAVGSAMTKDPVNHGLESLNESIRQHIQAQKDAAQSKRLNLEDQRSLLGTMAKTFGDDRVAEEAAWLAYLQKAQTTMAKIAAESKNATIQARYQAARAGIMDEIASHAQKWEALTQDHVTRVQHDVNAPAVYSGGAGGTEGLNHKEEEAAKDLSQGLVKSGVPGAREDLNRLLAVVPKEGDIPGVGGVHGAANALGGKAERIDNAAYNLLGSTQGQEIRQAAAVLFNRQLKDESGAAVSDQELDRQKAAFYGARDARSARAALISYGNRLNALEATVRSQANPKINQVQRQRQATESKRLERDKRFTGPSEAK